MKHRLLVGFIALTLFVPFLGSVRLFDWDEINFAECAREMIETDDYMHVQVDFAPFYEKPPLFIWCQVLSMKIFGVNEFAARLPNAIIGAITLVILFSIGQRVWGTRAGYVWTLIYAGSLLPHFYFRSGIIDPLFNLFIFLAVIFMMRSTSHNITLNATIAGAFAALAVMTKGPVGAGLVMLTTGVVWLTQLRTHALPLRQLLTAGIVAVALSSVWYVVDYLQNGPTFVMENIHYQWRLLTSSEAGHEQPFWYHPVVILFGCFPASLLFVGGFPRLENETAEQQQLQRWMLVLFWVVLIVFSIVKTKIIHYSSLTYIPLTYLAMVYVERWLDNRAHWRWFTTFTTFFIGTALTAVVALVCWAFIHPDFVLGLPTFKDEFLKASLQRPTNWTGIEPYLACILLAGTALAWWFRRRNKKLVSVGVLFGSVALFVCLFLPLVAPSIEHHTQGAALDFYESKVDSAVYIKPLTIKSYAHLFYQQKPRELSAAAHGMDLHDWEPFLLTDSLDRPAYFVARVNDEQQWLQHPNLEVIKRTGGYVFFKRR